MVNTEPTIYDSPEGKSVNAEESPTRLQSMRKEMQVLEILVNKRRVTSYDKYFKSDKNSRFSNVSLELFYTCRP